MPRFKEQAVCIRHVDWSETSQVVVLLTRGMGKLRGLAKGSKRMSPSAIAKFSGGIELLTYGQAVGVTRPAGQLTTLTEWDLQNDHYHLRTSLSAQKAALYAADLCDSILADEDPHEVIFDGLVQLLTELAEPAVQKQPAKVLLVFVWQVLVETGYKPELYRDVRRDIDLPLEHTNLSEQKRRANQADQANQAGQASQANQTAQAKTIKAYSFDPVGGGLSLDESIADWRVRPQTVDLLRQLESGELIDDDPNLHEHDRSTQKKINDPQTARRALRLLAAYVQHVLDQQLSTHRALFADKS